MEVVYRLTRGDNVNSKLSAQFPTGEAPKKKALVTSISGYVDEYTVVTGKNDLLSFYNTATLASVSYTIPPGFYDTTTMVAWLNANADPFASVAGTWGFDTRLQRLYATLSVATVQVKSTTKTERLAARMLGLRTDATMSAPTFVADLPVDLGANASYVLSATRHKPTTTVVVPAIMDPNNNKKNTYQTGLVVFHLGDPTIGAFGMDKKTAMFEAMSTDVIDLHQGAWVDFELYSLRLGDVVTSPTDLFVAVKYL